MKKIKLRGKWSDREAIVDDEMFEKISAYSWYYHRRGYAFTTIWNAVHKKNKTILMHRMIFDCSSRAVIDHKNGDKLDNRTSNLRVCTQSLNCANRSKQSNNKSGYKGVVQCVQKKSIKWIAYIRKNGKTINLGYFNTPLEAFDVYKKESIKLFGNFSYFKT